MTLRNNYAILDEDDTPAPFQLPPIPCGTYHLAKDFGGYETFYFRRMPRRAKHTGKYGLFYEDEDAGEVLIAVVENDGKTFIGILDSHKGAYGRFVSLPSRRELVRRACAWCGRVLTQPTLIHASCHSISKKNT